MKTHHVIIVPGLGDTLDLIKFSTHGWERLGVIPHVHTAPWKKVGESFEKKLSRLLKLIDKLKTKDTNVSLIGTSAGGSFVLNAYAKRKSKIHCVINICGRLIPGEKVFPSLEMAARKSPAFKESVIQSEKNIKSFSKKDLAKFMTFTSLVDELVPSSTSYFKGAKNEKVPMIGHMFSITFAITGRKKEIIRFIKEE